MIWVYLSSNLVKKLNELKMPRFRLMTRPRVTFTPRGIAGLRIQDPFAITFYFLLFFFPAFDSRFPVLLSIDFDLNSAPFFFEARI